LKERRKASMQIKTKGIHDHQISTAENTERNPALMKKLELAKKI
jgi:hypothetical protein